MLIEKGKSKRVSLHALLLLEKAVSSNEDSSSTLENERLIHAESLVACKTKYKDALASERSICVEKLTKKSWNTRMPFRGSRKLSKSNNMSSQLIRIAL